MSLINVYHTTKKGNGKKIVNNGWIVPREIHIGQVYGRGIYFWELISDAHEYGKRIYGTDGYEIIEETIPLIEGRYEYYDHHKRIGRNHDDISKGLIRKGIYCLVISRAYMDMSTIEAKGKAYVWLVDIDNEYLEVKY